MTAKNYRPGDEEIARVMAETGMDYLQARSHLIQRHALRDMYAASARAKLLGVA